MVRFLVLGSCPRMDKVFFFLTLLNVDLEWMARDIVSLLGVPSSFLFLFLSKVSSNHKSIHITLEDIPREYMLYIFSLAGVVALVVKEKGFFEVCETGYDEP